MNIKHPIHTLAALLAVGICHAAEPSLTGEREFVRSVVRSLITDPAAVTFEVAEQVFAIDNGEKLAKAEIQKAWPEFAKRAFKKKVTVDEFFAAVDLQIQPVANHKKIMSNKKLLETYQPQPGDLYCDASHVKQGTDDFIGYGKALIYLIRKTGGKWLLIGIGG